MRRTINSYLLVAARECSHVDKVPVETGNGTLCLGCAAVALRDLLEQPPEKAEESQALKAEFTKGEEGFPRLVLMLGDEKVSRAAKGEIARALRLLGVLPIGK